MGIRPRILLILLLLGVGPALSLALFNYLTGARVVETELREAVRRDVRAVASDIAKRLREREEASATLSRSAALRSLVESKAQQAATSSAGDLLAEIRAFLQSSPKYNVAVACLNTAGQPLFRAELSKSADNSPVRVLTQDFLPESVKADERVWSVTESAPLHSAIRREAYGSGLRYTFPVFTEQESATAPRGALIVDINLDALLNDAAAMADAQTYADSSRRLVIILDRDGNILYHTNSALRYQVAGSVLPSSFALLTGAMKRGEAGWQFYDSTDGRWLAAYQPVAPLNLSVAVAGDYSDAVRDLRMAGWLGAAVMALLSLLMIALVWLSLRRTEQSIERITEGASAIAGGRLDERIEVRSSDETRELADAFNAMTERLREQIAREAETRQFASFMRLSAMLTHDLKNSILSLSLLVSNMEQQFDRAEFRADAMKSLTEATDKLRSLVAKLSEPVRSLSGEFKRPRPIDLIPIIRDILARTVEPSQSLHEVLIDLPSSLVAFADEERIEKVAENLVLNALEAMGTEKGKLTVKAGPSAEDGFVFFSVSDTGRGMSEEFQRTKLFRPFSTTKSQGVGLGLYTSRELVRALGGRIDVESKQGSGTTFTVVLPSGQIKKSGG